MRGGCGPRRAVIPLVAQAVPDGVAEHRGGWEGHSGDGGFVDVKQGDASAIQAITISILAVDKFHGGWGVT